MQSSTAAEPYLDELLDRAVLSRGTSRFPTPEEMEYMKAVVRVSRLSHSIREFIVRLCRHYLVGLVAVEFRISKDAQMGYRPTVYVATREVVPCWIRRDMEGLVSNIIHMINFDAYGYRVLVVRATEIPEEPDLAGGNKGWPGTKSASFQW